MFNLISRCCVCVCASMISGQVVAQEMFLPPEPRSRPLAPDGTYVVADFASVVLNPEYPNQVTVVQTPPPGTVLSGVQIVPMNITGTDSLGYEDSTSFDLTLEDITAPDIVLGLTPSAELRSTPDGIPYFLDGVEVLPSISASDACDASPSLDLWVDGEPWTDRLPVTEPTLHTFYARATDDSGNVGEASLIFEIRARPYHAATAVVEQYDCQVGPDGIESVLATVYVASSEFAALDISLSTVQLWLVDDQNRWMNSSGIPISGAYPLGSGAYDHTTCQAVCDDGYWTLSFEHVFATPIVGNAPVGVALTGRGLHDQPEAFDWKAETLAQVDPQPILTLSNQGLLTGDPPSGPGFETQPTCQWKSEWDPDAPDHYYSEESGFLHYWHFFLYADYQKISGIARCETNNDSVGDAAAVISGGTLRVFLEPTDCCSECTINVVARPQFKIYLAVNLPAQAGAGGKISVNAGCGSAVAEGAVAIGDFDQETINIEGHSIPVSNEESPVARGYQDNLNCSIDECSAQISVGTVAYAHIWATTYTFSLDRYAMARAQIYDAKLNLSVAASANGGCGVKVVTIAFPVDN